MGSAGPAVSFYPEALSAAQSDVLRQLGPVMTERRFYLGGGTAVAIHLGHRQSLDLDWFSSERLTDPLRLAHELRDEGISFSTAQVERGTLHGTVVSVRLSLFEYRYELLAPLVPWLEMGCNLASLDDLAAMKLAAVAQRGSKKDFLDIYALGLAYAPLGDMLRLYQRKYNVQDIGHVLYSLAYFADADKERSPKLLWKDDWRNVKRTIQDWVRQVASPE
ncbi:MAG: nucleotidyl transferase AbiEii/AbiGii toxin family protein [Anaerolineae bacterium]